MLGAEKLQGEHELSFRTSPRRFPRTENDDESSIAAYKLQLTPPAGTEAPPAGTEGFSSKLFDLASSSLGRFSTNEPSLESLKSQQNDGAIFVPVSPRERTIAPFLRRVLTLSAQFPRIRTCSGQINLYRGEIAVRVPPGLMPHLYNVLNIMHRCVSSSAQAVSPPPPPPTRPIVATAA